MGDITENCLWQPTFWLRGPDGSSTYYFHCDVHDHNKVHVYNDPDAPSHVFPTRPV